MPFYFRLGKRSQQYNVANKDLFVIPIELLTDECIECTLFSASIGQDALNNVCQKIGLQQPEYFGLLFKSKKNVDQWVDLNRPLKKQLDKYSVEIRLYFRLQYFVPSFEFIHDEVSRYHYFRAMKGLVNDGCIACNREDAILLASFSLQAEFGDYNAERHTVEYLNNFGLFPKAMIASKMARDVLVECAINAYRSLHGVPTNVAEIYYISEAQQRDGYGQKGFPAKDLDVGADVCLGVCIRGIFVVNTDANTMELFKWMDIANLIYHKKVFTIERTLDNYRKNYSTFDADYASCIWRACVQQHQYFIKGVQANEAGGGSGGEMFGGVGGSGGPHSGAMFMPNNAEDYFPTTANNNGGGVAGTTSSGGSSGINHYLPITRFFNNNNNNESSNTGATGTSLALPSSNASTLLYETLNNHKAALQQQQQQRKGGGGGQQQRHYSVINLVDTDSEIHEYNLKNFNNKLQQQQQKNNNNKKRSSTSEPPIDLHHITLTNNGPSSSSNNNNDNNHTNVDNAGTIAQLRQVAAAAAAAAAVSAGSVQLANNGGNGVSSQSINNIVQSQVTSAITNGNHKVVSAAAASAATTTSTTVTTVSSTATVSSASANGGTATAATATANTATPTVTPIYENQLNPNDLTYEQRKKLLPPYRHPPDYEQFLRHKYSAMAHLSQSLSSIPSRIQQQQQLFQNHNQHQHPKQYQQPSSSSSSQLHHQHQNQQQQQQAQQYQSQQQQSITSHNNNNMNSKLNSASSSLSLANPYFANPRLYAANGFKSGGGGVGAGPATAATATATNLATLLGNGILGGRITSSQSTISVPHSIQQQQQAQRQAVLLSTMYGKNYTDLQHQQQQESRSNLQKVGYRGSLPPPMEDGIGGIGGNSMLPPLPSSNQTKPNNNNNNKGITPFHSTVLGQSLQQRQQLQNARLFTASSPELNNLNLFQKRTYHLPPEPLPLPLLSQSQLTIPQQQQHLSNKQLYNGGGGFSGGGGGGNGWSKEANNKPSLPAHFTSVPDLTFQTIGNGGGGNGGGNHVTFDHTMMDYTTRNDNNTNNSKYQNNANSNVNTNGHKNSKNSFFNFGGKNLRIFRSQHNTGSVPNLSHNSSSSSSSSSSNCYNLQKSRLLFYEQNMASNNRLVSQKRSNSIGILEPFYYGNNGGNGGNGLANGGGNGGNCSGVCNYSISNKIDEAPELVAAAAAAAAAATSQMNSNEFIDSDLSVVNHHDHTHSHSVDNNGGGPSSTMVNNPQSLINQTTTSSSSNSTATATNSSSSSLLMMYPPAEVHHNQVIYANLKHPITVTPGYNNNNKGGGAMHNKPPAPEPSINANGGGGGGNHYTKTIANNVTVSSQVPAAAPTAALPASSSRPLSFVDKMNTNCSSSTSTSTTTTSTNGNKHNGSKSYVTIQAAGTTTASSSASAAASTVAPPPAASSTTTTTTTNTSTVGLAMNSSKSSNASDKNNNSSKHHHHNHNHNHNNNESVVYLASSGDLGDLQPLPQQQQSQQKKSQPQQSQQPPSQPRMSQFTNFPKNSRIIVFEKSFDDQDFTREFELLPRMNPTAKFSTASLPDNILKNRFRDILPYEENRVKLTPTKDNKHGYINASHVHMRFGTMQQHYIAAQGPLPNTTLDFWQMVAEQNINLIVMVTNFTESGAQKCYTYLPLSNEPGKNSVRFADYEIICNYTAISQTYITSFLTLCHGGQKRQITHLRYTDWNDHSIPGDLQGFLSFLSEMDAIYRRISREGSQYLGKSSGGGGGGGNAISNLVSGNIGGKAFQHIVNIRRQKDKSSSSSSSSSLTPVVKGPATILVHCSAGAGRSGVVILCDALLKCLDHNFSEPIDIPRALIQLRFQRMISVQHCEQFRFVCQVLSQYLTNSRLI